MTVAAFPDQELITAFFVAQLAQPVYDDGYPEPADMPWVGDVLAPYVVIEYGMPVSTADGRSIAAEEKQPTIQRVAVSCVASNGKVAREVASKVASVGVGFISSDNVGPLRLVGGGSFTQKVESRPTVYVSEVYFSYLSNMKNL
jgi:hypothetical protein